MTWQSLLPLLWEFLNSPVGVSLVAGVALWAINKLYTAKPGWEKYEGSIIRGIQWAEREIPDNAPNKHIRRADAALKFVLAAYESMSGKRANNRLREELAQGIEIIHAEMETTGILPPSPGKDSTHERNTAAAANAAYGLGAGAAAGGVL